MKISANNRHHQKGQLFPGPFGTQQMLPHVWPYLTIYDQMDLGWPYLTRFDLMDLGWPYMTIYDQMGFGWPYLTRCDQMKKEERRKTRKKERKWPYLTTTWTPKMDLCPLFLRVCPHISYHTPNIIHLIYLANKNFQDPFRRRLIGTFPSCYT